MKQGVKNVLVLIAAAIVMYVVVRAMEQTFYPDEPTYQEPPVEITA